MISANTTVKNKTGLHARPASELARFCQKYESSLFINSGDTQYDLKSIVSIMSMGLKQGTPIEVVAEGPDENEAVNEVVTFIESLTE